MATNWYQITLNDNGGSGSSPASYWAKQTSQSTTAGQIYSVANYRTKSDSISNYLAGLDAKPTRTYYSYNGHWTSKSGGTQLVARNGGLASGSIGIVLSSALTIYAHWTRLSYLCTLDRQSGTGGTASIYGKVGGGWYSTWKCENEVTAITPPTRAGYAFRGYYTAANGSGTLCINADGSFAGDFALRVLDAAITLYAHWAQVHTITVVDNGGTGGTSAFYFEGGTYYAEPQCVTAITAITPPTKSSSVFLGLYDADSTIANQRVAPDGTIDATWTPIAEATLYAQWRTVTQITMDNGAGDGGYDAIYYDSADGEFHLADDPAVLDAVETPHEECYAFLGYYSASTGGTQYIDAAGEFLPAFRALSFSEPITIYAQYQHVSYKVTLDARGGESNILAFYHNGVDAAYYTSDVLAGDPITALPMPTMEGYDCTGYWTQASGGDIAVSAAGVIDIIPGQYDSILYAHWTARSYTASFDYAGGTGSVSSKTVTWGEAIGNLPSATAPASRPDAIFGGWTLRGTIVTAATIWQTDGNATLVALWITAHGTVEDWFALGSDALIPFASDSGEAVQRIAVSHMGKYSVGSPASEGVVRASSGKWRNPSVRYMVVRDCNIALTLGKAYAAVKSGTRMLESGYMIVSATVETVLGQFPVLTVQGAANEGADAINKWDISIPVLARARAQNIQGAVVGGGNLHALSLTAVCDPVVVAENMMPCASDVVNGRWESTAETLATESATTAPTAGGGFEMTSLNTAMSGTDYRRYSLALVKEMT